MILQNKTLNKLKTPNRFYSLKLPQATKPKNLTSDVTWCMRHVVQRKQICYKYLNSILPHLDYNDLGTTITTCRLFTIESVDN